MPEKKIIDHYNYFDTYVVQYNINSTNRFSETYNSFIKNYIIFVNNSKRCSIIEIFLVFIQNT